MCGLRSESHGRVLVDGVFVIRVAAIERMSGGVRVGSADDAAVAGVVAGDIVCFHRRGNRHLIIVDCVDSYLHRPSVRWSSDVPGMSCFAAGIVIAFAAQTSEHPSACV